MHKYPGVYNLVGSPKHKFESSWAIKGEYIVNYDGTNPEWVATTRNISGDPLLVQAIHDIRDEYFELFNEQMDVRRQKNALSWRSRLSKDEKSKGIKRLQEKVDRKLIIHNRDSVERLQQPDYGYAPEEKQSILEDAKIYPLDDCGQPLPEKEAYMLVSKIIGRSIDSYEIISGHDRKRVGVPKSFDPDSISQGKKKHNKKSKEVDYRVIFPKVCKILETPESLKEALPQILERFRNIKDNPGYRLISKTRDSASKVYGMEAITDKAESNFVIIFFDTMNTSPGEEHNLKMRELKEARSQLAGLYADHLVQSKAKDVNVEETREVIDTYLRGTVSATLFHNLKSMKLIREDTSPGTLYDKVEKGGLQH